MALIEIEDKIVEIINKENKEDFIYDFLKIYDIPNSTITRLKKGTNDLSKIPGEVHLKNKLYFKETANDVFEAFIEIESKVNDSSAIPRYLFVTDFKVILAKDTKTGESLDIEFKELPIYFSFFLAWNGIEKVDFEKENPLDIKAAERFARLFDVLNKEIESNSEEQRHALNLFLMRLLFCLFAEDTDIFRKGQFTSGIKQYTNDDGNNLNDYIAGLFKILDTQPREEMPTIYKDFPYVNGQLFTEPHQPIKFNKKARKLILECGELLDWSKINPDIFGSMIQAVATEDNRSHLGMHYTSVPNIMKVINPLFLDEIKQQFREIKDSWNDSFHETHLGKKKIFDTRKKHLDKISELTNKIKNMKFFDPACGSGNFLIITYKELRQLEIDIYVLMNEINDAQMLMYEPIVTLSQFYGIEIDEFASDIAKLSLWIAEHQMNIALKAAVAEAVRPTLPLRSAGDIRCSNALRVDWNDVCLSNEKYEVFIFGNPPYVGSKKQQKCQKEEMTLLFEGVKNYKQLDYIAAWFKKGSEYIDKNNAKLAFVTVDSITQGEQVFVLWTDLFKYNLDISFAYKSFKWSNNARNKAGVIVQIIGLAPKKSMINKFLFIDSSKIKVSYINPYLTEGTAPLVEKSSKILFEGLPKMNFGNMPNGKDLIFSVPEYENLIAEFPKASIYFEKYIGSEEFLNGTYRYCLWLDHKSYLQAMKIPIINHRIQQVKKARLNSSDSSANKLASTPYKFRDTNVAKSHSLIVPSVSSENRYYIPMGFVDSNIIPSNLVNVVYDAPIYLLGVLMSRMHMVWSKAVGGKKGSSYRYTIGLCYNTFPFRTLTKKEKEDIEKLVFKILDEREEDGRNLAEMYMPSSMSINLKYLHNILDERIDRLYSGKKFNSDEERLSCLLSMYKDFSKK